MYYYLVSYLVVEEGKIIDGGCTILDSEEIIHKK